MVTPIYRDAADFDALLQSLYTALGNLPTGGYQWDPSDRWTQALYPGGQTRHLETWIDLGGAVSWDRAVVRHEAALVVAMRYHPDDDSISQARIHAAARCAMDMLQGWSMTDGTRALPTGVQPLELATAEWVRVTVTFTLTYPRTS